MNTSTIIILVIVIAIAALALKGSIGRMLRHRRRDAS